MDVEIPRRRRSPLDTGGALSEAVRTAAAGATLLDVRGSAAYGRPPRAPSTSASGRLRLVGGDAPPRGAAVVIARTGRRGGAACGWPGWASRRCRDISPAASRPVARACLLTRPRSRWTVAVTARSARYRWWTCGARAVRRRHVPRARPCRWTASSGMRTASTRLTWPRSAPGALARAPPAPGAPRLRRSRERRQGHQRLIAAGHEVGEGRSGRCADASPSSSSRP